MICAITTGKTKQDRVVVAFAKSCNATIIPITQYLQKGLPVLTESVILAGILRGNSLLLNECKKKGIEYYFIDHAYFNAGYSHNNWMRITKNGYVQNQIIESDPTRWNRYFNRSIAQYYYKNKRKILVLPPSDATARTLGEERWLSSTIRKLKEHTDRQVIIRHKSGPVLDHDMIRLKDWRKYNYSPWEEVWPEVYCVIAFNSNLAIDALIRGVPVITSKYSAAWPISNKIENIENLVEHNRYPLCYSLAWGQYNYAEIESGFAYRSINNFNQAIGI